MIKTKAIRKIFITTMTMFILLTVFSIPMLESKEDVLKVNMEVVDSSDIKMNNIYLLNEEGYLVKTEILLDEKNVKDNILKILNYLIKSDTSKYTNGLSGVIPEGVKVLSVFCGNELVTIDFSKEILNVSSEEEKQMIAAIVYSILDIEGIKGVSILVDGVNLDKYPKGGEELDLVLTKDIGINIEYDIKTRDNINKVVLYYVEKIDDNNYYVPVTKYLNDEREKIKIIIEELTTSYIYEENLMSFLNSKTKLIDYRETDDALFLNFNEYLYDVGDKVLEEVIYCIGYSVFDNYDVSVVMFEINGKEVGHITRK